MMRSRQYFTFKPNVSRKWIVDSKEPHNNLSNIVVSATNVKIDNKTFPQLKNFIYDLLQLNYSTTSKELANELLI